MERQIIFQHLETLKIYARHITGDRDQAEELLQDVILHVLSHPVRESEVEHPKAYFKTILRNRFLDQCRRSGREPQKVVLEDSCAVMDQDRTGDRLELSETTAAIERLPVDLRGVLKLRVEADQSYDEIARTLGLPVGTVMSRLSRARHRLREELGENEPV